MPILTVDALTSRFRTRAGTVHAVNDVSFEVPGRSIVGVVGESGCGKSAMIRSIIGLLPANGYVESGNARFEGKNLLQMSAKEMRLLRGNEIGFIAQRPWGSLHPIIRIERQFRSVIRAHRKLEREKCRELALTWLNRVRIRDPERVLHSHAHELSGGMAQRVVIALGMVLDPKLVIADEPTTALDVTVQRQILELVRELIVASERSMILVTHDIGVVAQYCDHVVVMYAGEVVESGPTSLVLTKPAHPYTEALLNAVPRRGEALAELRGSPPQLVTYDNLCSFADRCSYADGLCRASRPLLEAAENGGLDLARMVRCHHELTSNR